MYPPLLTEQGVFVLTDRRGKTVQGDPRNYRKFVSVYRSETQEKKKVLRESLELGQNSYGITRSLGV